MELFFAYYTLGALASFSVCFKAFVNDSTTPLSDQTSWGVLAVTTVFWPITIPISWLELTTKSQTAIIPSSGSIVENHFYPPQITVIKPSPAETVQPLPKKVNNNQLRFLPLGYLLRQAGLVTDFQIKFALQVQKDKLKHLRLGEILVVQGWIEPETINFFVEHLPNLHQQFNKKSLSEYLKMAKLLDDQQINEILTENPKTNLQLGELAVEKGWVKPETINLILHYLGEQYQVQVS
jgi:N-acetylglucosaminyldiphosphoundecaprenol N-acetyl-beta-D-mannosaminyltransferase